MLGFPYDYLTVSQSTSQQELMLLILGRSSVYLVSILYLSVKCWKKCIMYTMIAPMIDQVTVFVVGFLRIS